MYQTHIIISLWLLLEMGEIHEDESLWYLMQAFVFPHWEQRRPDSFPTDQRFSDVQPHPLIAAEAGERNTALTIRQYVLDGGHGIVERQPALRLPPRYSTNTTL